MAHVQITQSEIGKRLVIDGHDVTKSVLAEGAWLDLEAVPAVLHIAVAVDDLDADLPNAVLEAVKA